MSRTFTAVLMLLLLANVAAAVTVGVGFRPGALWYHVPPTWLVQLMKFGLPLACLGLFIAAVLAATRRFYPAAASAFLVVAGILAEYAYFAWVATHA